MRRAKTTLGILAVATPIAAACGVTLEGQVSPGTETLDGAVETSIPGDGPIEGAAPMGGLAGCDAVAVVPSVRFDFGKIPVDGSASGRVRLTNVTSSTVVVTASGLGGPFRRVGDGLLTLMPDVEAGIDMSFHPTVAGDATSSLHLSWPGCAGTDVSVAGGTLAPNEVGVSPATLTLPSAPCGSAGGPTGDITLSTTGSATWTASVGSPFLFLSTMGATANGSAPGVVVVGTGALPKNAPPSTFASEVAFSFMTPAVTTGTVHVETESTGVYVGANPQMVKLEVDGNGSVLLTNSGNRLAKLQLAPVKTGYLTLTPSVFDLAPKASQSVAIFWDPNTQSHTLTSMTVKIGLTMGTDCGGDASFTVSQPL